MGGASGHTYTFTIQPDGLTRVDAVVIREGKNLKGKALGLALASIRGLPLRKAFAETIKAIEARNADTVPSAAVPAA